MNQNQSYAGSLQQNNDYTNSNNNYRQSAVNTRRSTLLAAQAALNSAVIASNSARLNNIPIPSSSSSISKSLANGTITNPKLNKTPTAPAGLISNTTNYAGVLYSTLTQQNINSSTNNNNNIINNSTTISSSQPNSTNSVRRTTRSSSNALSNTANAQKRYCT